MPFLAQGAQPLCHSIAFTTHCLSRLLLSKQIGVRQSYSCWGGPNYSSPVQCRKEKNRRLRRYFSDIRVHGYLLTAHLGKVCRRLCIAVFNYLNHNQRPVTKPFNRQAMALCFCKEVPYILAARTVSNNNNAICFNCLSEI